ncbi:DoxX family protein, partial [Roseimaritima sediminicola]|uniref:DoxX family protein n=1 Tax=Roseimaritima sediminicola TaxID=2662066 RepID=UPI00192A633B
NMNTVLWVLQALIALHTLMGAVWKFSNSAEETMPSLKAIPNGAWIAMGGFEILLSICFLIPLIYKPWDFLAPVAAVCIVAEMLLFIGLHYYSGDSTLAPVAYWLVVAVICGFIAFGRFMLVG